MASSYSSSVTVSQVGSEFVQQYYHVLQQQPEIAHQFYTGSSTMIRVDGESTETASAISQIQKLVQSLHFSGIEIKTISSFESWSAGIIVVVFGSVKSDCCSRPRKFVQTFFLAPQENEKGYIVLNDIFHFVSKKNLLDVIRTKHPIEIFYIRRKDRETVEDFLFRFTKETMWIPRADEDSKIIGFIRGVCNDNVVRLLSGKIPKTFVDMIDRVKGYVRGEKACAFLDDADTPKSARSKRPRNRKRRRRRGADSLESWMKQPITFPAVGTNVFHEGPFVITAKIAGLVVHRVHVDGGSASEIMYESCFKQLDEVVQRNLIKDTSPLVGLCGDVLRPIGKIRLPVIIGEGGRSRALEMTFLVVRACSSPNIVIGRSGIRALGAVVSTIHGAMKFPTPTGITTILSKGEHRVDQGEQLNTDDSD